MTTPPTPSAKNGPWIARLVALLLAAVSIPYCLFALVLLQNELRGAGLALVALLLTVAFLPSAIRAYWIGSRTSTDDPSALRDRLDHWGAATAMTVSIVVAAHIAFACVCIPAGFTTFEISRRPRPTTFGEDVYHSWPWAAGVLAASWAAYGLTGWYLRNVIRRPEQPP
jgi:hypothetical protein